MDQDRAASVSTRIATEGSKSGTYVGLCYRSDELTEEVDEDAERAIRWNESS